MELAILDVVVFVGFLAAVVTVGLLASRHEKDSEAYFLAGRGLNWCLIGFSLIAANISAEQFVGMSGQAAMGSVGLAIASYEWIAAITLVAVAFFFLPKFLRSGIYTIPEYLEYRYSHTARTLMSLLMVIIYVGVNIATVIFLGAKAFQPFFAGLDIPVLGELGIAELSVIIGVVAAVYVAAGGLRACARADLIQGSALILGGAVILVLVLMALDHPEQYEEIDAAQVHASLDVQPDATLGEKLRVVKANSMHMVKEADNAVIPWTALLLGIWIPNFYYWGLNQYIMQRSLAARSLSQGQMGVVFAAALKLIIPFVVCVPGILAFTLYAPKMQENAMTDSRLNGLVLPEFERQRANPAEADKVFPFNDDFAQLHPELAEEVFLFNAAVAGVEIPSGASVDQVRELATRQFVAQDPVFQKELEKLQKELEENPDKPAKPLLLKQLNDEAVTLASGGRLSTAMRLVRWLKGERPRAEKQQELIGYDYDGAFPLLMRYVTRKGLRGFVLAALMGAVVSTLASMLNAAS
ncbi:MAG: SLC5 family protein, partial [Phycisphaerae bacterium]